MSETLAEYLASQDELVQEASEALPHQFSQCTYALGPIRQAIYLCRTCPEARGFCSACSIACHTDHEQIELFPKRNFRCDCPTGAIAHPCVLHTNLEPVNNLNQYGQNFEGLFCRCKRPYDASTEKETMIQCLTCEDWFHESCCNLRERLPSREPSPEIKDQSNITEDPNGDIDAASETSSGLPPPLIGPSEYDSFVCSTCVFKIPVLQKWLGTPGCLTVVRDTPSTPWKVLPRKPESNDDAVNIVSEPPSSASGEKRPPSPTALDETSTKKARLSPSSCCLAPAPNAIAQKILSDVKSGMNVLETSLGAGDIFLTDGFRSRWCRCSACLPSLEANPCLLEEEETYEPPDDPDSGLSLEELGLRALSKLPHANAIDRIQAFNSMRDDLVSYLRPFAQEGKVVNEADVRRFFDSLMEAKRANSS